MAITQMGSPSRFKGLSGDTKPTTCAADSTFLEEDTLDRYQFDGVDDWFKLSTGGAEHTLEQGVIGGGRNQDSTTNNYDVTHEEGNKTFFNPDATTEQVITAAPAFIYGFVGKVGTGTFTIRDDSAANGAVTDFPVYTLAVGTQVTFPCAVRMETGITGQCSVGTDEVTVFWRPI